MSIPFSERYLVVLFGLWLVNLYTILTVSCLVYSNINYLNNIFSKQTYKTCRFRTEIACIVIK